jgi:tellurite resistance protein
MRWIDHGDDEPGIDFDRRKLQTVAIRAKVGELMRRGLRRSIRPNLFGIAFGIAGLAEAWRAAESTIGTPQLVVNTLNVIAAALWALLVVSYGAQGPRQVLADLRDHIVAPFVPLSSITAMLLAAALSQYAFVAGRALVVIFVAITIGLGAG